MLSGTLTWGDDWDYKTAFMLKSAEFDILNAHKYRIIKKFSLIMLR